VSIYLFILSENFMSVINVIGIRKQKGQVEGGSAYDFSVIYAIGRLDPSATDRKGFSGIELRGLPEFYGDKYLNLAFTPQGIPFDVEIEQIAVGKGMFKDTIVSMTPTPVKSAAPAAAIPRTGS
jgi:hypothetical protein